MNRPIALVLFTLAALLGSPLRSAEPAEIKLDEGGKWSVPLRYWYHPNLFENADGFAFLVEVKALGPQPITPAPDHLESPQLRKAELTVVELLSQGSGVPAKLAEVKMLDVEGAEGLSIGDRLVVLVARQPYEGGYVIDRHEGDCALGILLSPSSNAKLDASEEQQLLEYFKNPKPGFAELTPAEIKLWRKIDAKGVAMVRARQSP